VIEAHGLIIDDFGGSAIDADEARLLGCDPDQLSPMHDRSMVRTMTTSRAYLCIAAVLVISQAACSIGPAINDGIADQRSGNAVVGTRATDSEAQARTREPGCPRFAPANSDPCSSAGLQCEYGDDYTPACDIVASCFNGAWSVAAPRGACPTPIPDNGPSCPASLDEVPQGTACAPIGLTCGYDDGRCFCFRDHTGVPVDWGCFPGAGCPFPRPRIGSECATEGQQCDYAPCGNSIACSGGQWRLSFGGCHP
jgi:hypothetical protein